MYADVVIYVDEYEIDYEANMNIQMLMNDIHVEKCGISMIHEAYAIDIVNGIC